MHIFHVIALLLQFGVVLIGFPAQISRNYACNECGEPTIRVALLFLSFSTRFISTSIDGVWYVFIPDIFGVLLLGIS